MSHDALETPLGHVVVGGANCEAVPIFDQLFIGRECAGVGERRRLVIEHPEVSRSHVEIRLDTERDRAYLIDTSTNGTLLNGIRLDRAVPTPLRSGDEIRIGSVTLTFRSSRFTDEGRSPSGDDYRVTRTRISTARMVLVVGDLANYSTIAEATQNTVVADSLRVLWADLAEILRGHRGTLNHYAGDALYAVWDLETEPQANRLALDFALAAHERVERLGPTLPLRSAEGAPIRMGWAVVQGDVAMAAFTRSVEAVIGDATNLAFRLAGLAGRDGRPPVIATDTVRAAVARLYRWGEPEHLQVKGRTGVETVYPVLEAC